MVEKFLKKIEKGIAKLRSPRQTAPPIDISSLAPQTVTGNQATEVLETIGIPGGIVNIVDDGQGNIIQRFVPNVIAFRSKNLEREEDPWNFPIDDKPL